MHDGSHMTLTLETLGVGTGWSCLLVGEDVEEASVRLQERVGPGARVLVAGTVLPDGPFDFIWARGPSDDLARLVERLWFGGLILVEDTDADGDTLAARLAAAGLAGAQAGAGMAHGRRPQGTYNLW